MMVELWFTSAENIQGLESDVQVSTTVQGWDSIDCDVNESIILKLGTENNLRIGIESHRTDSI